MYKGHNILAVIPARAGSKGIPNKNLQKINSKTLIEHAVDCARACDIFEKIIIVTDDAENIGDLWKSVWDQELFEYSCLLEPTSPLRRPEDVISCLDYLIDISLDNNLITVATISKLPKATNPHKIISLHHGEIFFPYGFKQHRQDAPDYYRLNGACYAARRGFKDIFSNCGYVIIDRDLVNVDEPIDLEYARHLASKVPAEKIC